MTTPVTSDSGWGVGNRYEQDYGIPSQTLLGPGLEVVVLDSASVSTSQIEDALP